MFCNLQHSDDQSLHHGPEIILLSVDSLYGLLTSMMTIDCPKFSMSGINLLIMIYSMALVIVCYSCILPMT